MTFCYDSGGFMKKIFLALLLVLALVSTSEGQRNLRKIQRGNPTGSGDPLRGTAGGSPPAGAGGPNVYYYSGGADSYSSTQFIGCSQGFMSDITATNGGNITITFSTSGIFAL